MSLDLDHAGPATVAAASAEDRRARRLYLAYRRHDLLAPVSAIIEFSTTLLDDPRVQASPQVSGDLQTVRTYAERLTQKIDEVLDPERLDSSADAAAVEPYAKALNHDLRGMLTVVLGYSEDLKRRARKFGLADLAGEMDQIHQFGTRCLSLIDEIVAHLRGQDQEPGGAALAIDEIRDLVGDLDASADVLSVEPGRILVVDDNPDIRKVLGDALRRQGHEVSDAGDGASALALVRRDAPDLVLLDIVMPQVHGLHVLGQLKADATTRDIPVIMISGLSDLDGIARCIELGAEDYLPKPCNRLLLRARVDACLEKKRLRDRNEQQRRRFDELLHAILPDEIVTELAETQKVQPRRHEDVAVLFADIVGFTPYCDRIQNQPEIIVRDLQTLFETWEEIAARYQVQKIKTIGDAIMAACGLVGSDVENAVENCTRCGLEMIAATQRMPTGWNLRVGIHVGPVVAGVLGKRQYLYDLWGDTVNTAARLESHGVRGCANLSADAWDRISGLFTGSVRGRVEIKGKGPMDVIHLDPQVAYLASQA